MKKILNKKIILIFLIVIIFFIAIILIIVFKIPKQNIHVLTKNDYTKAVNNYLSKNTRWYIKDASELNNGFDLKIESKSIIFNKNSWEADVDATAYTNSDGYIPKPKNDKLTIDFKNEINDHDIESQLNKFGYFLKNPFPNIKSGTVTISGKSSKQYSRKSSSNFFDIDLSQIRVKGINIPLIYLNINFSQNSTFTFTETDFNNTPKAGIHSSFINGSLPITVKVQNMNNPGDHSADFKVPLALVGNNLRLNVANFFNQKSTTHIYKLLITDENLVINWSLKQ